MINLNETLNKILNKTFNEIHKINNFDKNRFFDEIIINQKIIFLLKNIITTKKIIFVLNAVIQIIQLKTVNFYLTLIKYF